LTEGAPRLLFVPVSGAFGMGEYARSLAIAQAAASRWPGAAIHFVLSREAPYAARTPFPTTLLASSPTFHSAAVIEVIEQWRPDLVVFDNAGRTAQLRAAKRSGAGVIYISARRRQRSKAFRMRWMRLIDEHWIAYPEFVAGSLSFVERLKLDVMRRPVVRYLDVILTAAPTPSSDADGKEVRQPLWSRAGMAADSYVLVVPGGGTGHPGASGAVEQFLGAARGLAAAGVDTLFVGVAERHDTASELGGGPGRTVESEHGVGRRRTHESELGGGMNRGDGGGHGAESGASRSEAAAHLRILGTLPQAELAELMRGARLIIANGGSTLLQSIACGKPCIAVPIAGDQNERIGRCVRVGAARAAALDSADMLRVATRLWGDEAQLETLAGRAIALGLADGVEVALGAMNALSAKRY
jgi:ADP-heptose:LPS heptosyltransferase